MKPRDRSAEFGDEQLRLLGRRLRELREARSWSLRRMATESGLSVAAVQSVEGGSANPSLLTVVALAEALAEPLDRLIADSRSVRAHVGTGRLTDVSAELEAPTRADMAARLLVVPARGATEPIGEEGRALFFYVLDGKVRFEFPDAASEELETGDALHLRGGLALRCVNLMRRRSRILFLTDRRNPADRNLEYA